MKRLLTAIVALVLIGASFNSCKKDDASSLSNSITIVGTFTIGDKTFTNPTFDLGKPVDLDGYLSVFDKTPIYNAIVIENSYIDLGNNYFLDFNLQIHSAVPGEAFTTYIDVKVYEDIPVKQADFYIYSFTATATVTSVGEVGGYIVGSYEGDFSYGTNKEVSFHVTGKFKVLRTDTPVK